MKIQPKFPTFLIFLALSGITLSSLLLEKDQILVIAPGDDILLGEVIEMDRSRDHEGDTFSIVAYDPVTGEVGGAACSCFSGTIDFLSDLVLDGSNNIIGGIHTQAAYVSGNQDNARTRMLAGDTPSEIITWLEANDCCSSNANSRQYGIVGFNGSTLETAGFTGSSNGNWAGNITGPNYAIQGNILDTSDQIDILNDMEAAFLSTNGTLADKLMAALQGAKRVGGDNRCQGSGQSGRAAFVKVLRPGDTTPYIFETTYPNIASYEPIDDLQCLYDAAVSTSFCRQTVSNFPYTMDFETKSWEKEATCSTYSSWIRSRFSTPSSNTGPSGSNQGTHYTFVEASDIGGQGTAPRSAIIGSPCFVIPSNNTAQLTFDYHMWGANMGTLTIAASDNGGSSWTTLWSISGDQGNSWTNDQSVDLSAYAGSTVKLRFDATLGNGYQSDMAIDDVQITITSIVPDNEPPTAPTNLVASNTTSTTTDLSWSPSTDNIGVTGYDIYEGAGVIGSSPTTSFNVTGLSPETNYSFTVIAKDAAGNESPPSNSVAVTTDVQPPVNCINLVDTFPYSESFESSFGVWIQSTTDDLDWTRDSSGTPSSNTGPSSAFDGTIYIYVEASGNGTGYPNKRAILESPCFDLGDKTAANFDFNYHMYGSNDMGSIDLEVSLDGGDSWASIWNQTGNQGNAWLSQSIDLASYLGESAVMVRFNRLTGGTWQADIAIDNITLVATGGPDTEPPTAPTNLTASNTTTTTTDLSWTASTDNVGVTGYDVYEGLSVIGSTASTNFNVTGLSPSTNYSFTVVAKDAAGNESPPSNAMAVTTDAPPDTEAPSVPMNLTASNTTTTSTDLSWTASTDNVGVTGYDVYEGVVVIGSTATNSFNVTGLTPSTNYSFTVVAKDAAGNESAASAPLGVTTLDDTSPPTAPTNLTASNTTTTTTDLSWTASTDDIGVTEYDIYEGAAVIGSSPTTSFNVTGLSPETNYSFTVVAKDAAGNESPPSNAVAITTDTPPDTEPPTAPTGLSASNTTMTSTDLSWTASTDNVGVTGYDVYEGVAVIGSSATTSFNVTGLAPATNYSFTVVAKDAAGNESAASTPLGVTTLDDTESPTAPTNLVASNTTSTTTDLDWTASTDNVGVTGYDVYEGVSVIGSAVATSFNVTGLLPSTNYSFSVVAKDAAGNESAASNIENITTLSGSSSTVLHQGFFETGLDGWIDGGSDCRRLSTSRSFEGSYSVRLRDNTNSSVMTLGTFDVTSYSSIEIEFYFYPNSMENGEDFWVQFHDGSSWNTVASYARGTDFENDSFYTATAIIDGGIYNFPTNAQFRFRCDASGNQDRIYIDQITITGNSGFAPISSNSITNLGGAFEGFLGDEGSLYIERDLVLYPNPVKTTLNVKLYGVSYLMTYRIIDITGKVVLIGDLSQNSIDVEKLQNGIYFMEVFDGEESMIQSFIKE
jgi:chitodextrinase/uncharacterized Ntn-hydrolase superfamily protein